MTTDNTQDLASQLNEEAIEVLNNFKQPKADHFRQDANKMGTQELDEIIDIFQDYTASLGYPMDQLSHTRGRQIHRQAILDWHNKQTEKAISADEFLNYLFRNGYVDREWDAKELEDTLNKLKESK